MIGVPVRKPLHAHRAAGPPRRATGPAWITAVRPPESYRPAEVHLHRPAHAAIEATAGGDAAVLSGWTADSRRRLEAALAALPRHR
jgi:enoyl-CoA hydratase